MGIFYVVKDEKRIEINRFFRVTFSEDEESTEFLGWVEISKEEYNKRKSIKI